MTESNVVENARALPGGRQPQGFVRLQCLSSHARVPFTVGIPVFDEEEILVANTERLVAHLDGLGREYQIVIASNGSTDATPELGRELERRFEQVSFLHLPDKGVGRAFREIVRRALHPHLVSIDMDLSIDLAFVAQALALLETHEVVVGSKKTGEQKRSRLRKLGSDSFLLAARVLLGLPYDDYSIAAKGYRVEVLRRHVDAIDAGTSYVLEICHRVQRDGGRIAQVPVSCEDWRVSKFNLWHEAAYKFGHLLRLWLRSRGR